MMKQGNNYCAYLGDCVEITRQLPNDSIHLTITSVPFANLYTYSDDPRDFSNVEDLDEFFKQMDYLIPELYRITAPGRIIALHCKQIPTFKGRDGAMGLVDFRGMLIESFKKHGWTYSGEITIWTDPQIEATRTKSASILWNSYKKYAEITRTGMADYIIMMRKCEREEEWIHIEHKATDDNFKLWTLLASPCWGIGEISPQIRRTNVLNAAIAKDDKDEKHMTPLQLDTIHYLIEWYSNPGEIVFDPFAGIMSTPYEAIRSGRKGLGIELKESYFNTGVNFLESVDKVVETRTLFDLLEEKNESKNL